MGHLYYIWMLRKSGWRDQVSTCFCASASSAATLLPAAFSADSLAVTSSFCTLRTFTCVTYIIEPRQPTKLAEWGLEAGRASSRSPLSENADYLRGTYHVFQGAPSFGLGPALGLDGTACPPLGMCQLLLQQAQRLRPHHQTEKHAEGVSIREVREEIILRELGLTQPEMGPPCECGRSLPTWPHLFRLCLLGGQRPRLRLDCLELLRFEFIA